MLQSDKGYCLVDVRTKTEFLEGSIPGSINIPLFDEEERARIGRVYSQNRRAAKFLAMDFAGPKIPKFVRSICRRCQGKPLLILCWRGGMRSHATVEFLNMVGLEAAQLRGGYHQYRKHIYQQLQVYKLESQVIVLKGRSGTGKTEILRLLGQQGYPVLDLEGLARHRGSSFGDWEDEKPQSQKNFDSLLLEKLQALRDSPYILLEGESRRIGNICLPKFLFTAMQKAPVFEIYGSLPRRTERILRDYAPRSCEARVNTYLALSRLEGILSKGLFTELKQCLDAEDYARFVELILVKHYDRLYEHKLPGKQVLARVNSDETDKAAAAIAALLEA